MRQDLDLRYWQLRFGEYIEIVRGWSASTRRIYAAELRPFFAYLVTVALNIQRDQWRAERWMDDRQEVLENITNEKEGNPASETEDREQQAILNDAIRQLPGIYRAVIALRYDADMRYEQIAEALNLPVNTVRTHLHRAKRLLRKWLEEKNG